MADELQDAAEGVPWRVIYREGALWELINNSDFPKFKVQISGPGVLANRTAKLFERIDGQSSEVFWGATHMGSHSRGLRSPGTDEKTETTNHTRGRARCRRGLSFCGRLGPPS